MSGKAFKWDVIQALAFPETNIIALTNVGAIIVYACSVFYNNRLNWSSLGNNVSDSEWDEISKAIGLLETQIMGNMVGIILPHALSSLSGLNMLPCDGAVYAREEWPLLYAALDSVYILDADTFFVPDLRDKMPIGEGDIFSIDEMGGEVSHELSVAEIPSHSHGSDPHSHSEITALPSLADFGTGAPVPSATPSAGITGFETVNIHNTGGNEPHNNMPPYRVVKFAIVAG